MTRLFVAVDVPEAIRQDLADLCCGLPGARWVSVEQMHVTLAFLGELEGGLALDVREALRGVKGAPFELSLRGLGHFPPRGEPRVAWAGVRASEPLIQLHAAIRRRLEQAGCELEHRKFHPHVTLARLRDTPPRRLAEWLAANGAFESAPFTVSEFVLYSSVLGATGATHRVEEVFPLQA